MHSAHGVVATTAAVVVVVVAVAATYPFAMCVCCVLCKCLCVHACVPQLKDYGFNNESVVIVALSQIDIDVKCSCS